MSDKLKIILIDNLIVRKMNLQIGENIIGNYIDTKIKDNTQFDQAAKINLSSDCKISITPCEGVLCYIKTFGTLRWKLIKPSWTQALNVKDTCLLFPNKIWFKIVGAKDTINESKSSKRKIEKLIEDELPDKRHCSVVSAEIEPSNNILYNNSNISKLIVANCIDNTDKMNEHDTIDSKPIQCSNIDIDDREPKFELYNEEQNNEQINLALNSDNNEDISKREELNEPNFSAYSNPDPEPSQQYVDLDLANINSNTDISNQMSTTNMQNIVKQKCKYGSQCYRISAEHKQKYSHPGDSDYDLPDNRPECAYGKKCYRQNPQHKIEYKHTHNKRKRAQTCLVPVLGDWEESSEESIDESEYEPSFIDDESLEEYESDFEEEE